MMVEPKFKNYVPVVTRRSYAVPIPERDFRRLTDYENKHPEIVNDLGTVLDKLHGVGCTEYNGHYGAVIYYNVDADKDTPELHARIVALIREHVHPRRRKVAT